MPRVPVLWDRQFCSYSTVLCDNNLSRSHNFQNKGLAACWAILILYWGVFCCHHSSRMWKDHLGAYLLQICFTRYAFCAIKNVVRKLAINCDTPMTEDCAWIMTDNWTVMSWNVFGLWSLCLIVDSEAYCVIFRSMIWLTNDHLLFPWILKVGANFIRDELSITDLVSCLIQRVPRYSSHNFITPFLPSSNRLLTYSWYCFAPISNGLSQISWMTCWNMRDEVSFLNYDVENDLLDIFAITFFTSEM